MYVSSKEVIAIPTVLLIALVGAIALPRHGIWVGGAAVVAWAAILLVEGSADSLAKFLGSVALGAANAAVVVTGVWIVRRTALTE